MPYVRKTRDYYEVEGNYGYGHGYEPVTAEDARREALARLREYRENEPGIPFRLRKRRERIAAVLLALALGLGAVAQAAPWPSAAPIEQQLVNINTATAHQLALLPGVGEKTAARIVVYRQAHRFTKPADLCAAGLPRFTGKTCAAVLPYVVVSGPTTAKAPIRATSSRPALRDVWVCAEDGADVSCDLYEADGSLATTVRLPKSAPIGSLFPARKAVR